MNANRLNPAVWVLVNKQRKSFAFEDIGVSTTASAGTARADDKIDAAEVDNRERFAFALRRLLLQGGQLRLQKVVKRNARFRVFPFSEVADFTAAVVTAVIIDVRKVVKLRSGTFRGTVASRAVGV